VVFGSSVPRDNEKITLGLGVFLPFFSAQNIHLTLSYRFPPGIDQDASERKEYTPYTI
jgi:hypothetical protein